MLTCLVGIAAALALGKAPLAQAYTRTVTGTGQAIGWARPAHFNLAGNPANASGLSENDVYRAVVRSLQRWQSASGGTVGFDYWQGLDRDIYPISRAQDELSTLHFTSQETTPSLGRGTLALTEVWYDVATGEIFEADVTLNDRDYDFTTRPGDSTFLGNTRAYLENVLSHEFGHVYGLAHSGLLQSTLLFRESREQAHLACDEQVAIRAVYGTPQQAASFAALTGLVRDPSGQPIFGAQVTLISVERGVALSGGLTNAGGRYFVAGLEPGNYLVLAEPYGPGAGTLPNYYDGMNPWVCDGQAPFARTVLGSLRTPRMIRMESGQAATADDLYVGCGAALQGSESGEDPSAQPAGRFAFFQSLYPGTSRTIALPDFTGGDFTVHGISFSLFSPVEARMQLQTLDHASVGAASVSPIYTGDSGFQNRDSQLSIAGLRAGRYELALRTAWINTDLYPMGSLQVADEPFVLVVGGSDLTPSGNLPVNARCRMDENFGPYASPPGEPQRSEGNSSGFCASTDSQRRGPPSGGQLVGWMLPWLLIAGLRAALSGWRRWGRLQPKQA